MATETDHGLDATTQARNELTGFLYKLMANRQRTLADFHSTARDLAGASDATIKAMLELGAAFAQGDDGAAETMLQSGGVPIQIEVPGSRIPARLVAMSGVTPYGEFYGAAVVASDRVVGERDFVPVSFGPHLHTRFLPEYIEAVERYDERPGIGITKQLLAERVAAKGRPTRGLRRAK